MEGTQVAPESENRIVIVPSSVITSKKDIILIFILISILIFIPNIIFDVVTQLPPSVIVALAIA